MGSFNDWEDDQDLYDWGSQFGKSNTKTEPKKNIEVVPEPKPEEEVRHDEPAPVVEEQVIPETPVEAPVEAEQPKPRKKPVAREDLEQLSSQQASSEEIIVRLRERVQHISSLCSENQYPKGIRTIIRLLDDGAAVAYATKVLVDDMLETNVEENCVIVDDSKLKSMSNMAHRTIKREDADLQKVLDELEGLVKAGEERVVLNLRTRIIKEKTSLIFRFAERLAQAYAVAIESYAPNFETLAVLGRYAQRGDRKVMDCVDVTLAVAGTSMVLVEDAPAMKEALDNNDTDTLIRLQQKLIDYLFERK